LTNNETLIIVTFSDITVIYKKASTFEIMKLYAYVMKINFKKVNRNYSLVDKEYNSGKWNRSFEDIEFETLAGNYARKDIDDIVIAPISNKLIKILRRDYQEKFKIEFLSFFKNFSQNSIIELGCGLGGNLFSLYNSGFRNLAGCDLSTNAIKNLKKYTKMKNIDIRLDECNLNEIIPQDLINEKIVFTNTCLEQCKHIMPNVLKNIINGKPKLVMNFEVDYDSSPYMVKKYFDACDYQNNLVRELNKLESENKIEILSKQKLVHSGSPVNRLSAIIWKIK
tara:strand:+ start:8664 stop:9506 length:843 start_codon:yes stop_codon:yes gene_type:complete